MSDAKTDPDNRGENRVIIIDGTFSFSKEQITSMLANPQTTGVRMGRQTGKIEFNTKFVEALVKSVNAEKPKPFHETLNDQKRRRSWRR